MGFCDDPAWERADARAVIKHYVTAFLLAELAEDSAASATLSPTQADLPHVRYRAAGF
jgi:hypothetical protein